MIAVPCRRFVSSVLLLIGAAASAACTHAPATAVVAADGSPPAVRWLAPAETAPHGEAHGAQARLLGTQPDGTKTYALVLSAGDEVWSALAAFANEHDVQSAHFSAIGAVRDPEVAWFDDSRRQFKAMRLHEQMEVLTLSGDITRAVNGHPSVHAHVALAGSDGRAWGGHLLAATASPTLEVFVTTYPVALRKYVDASTQLQLIDPSLGRE